MGHGNEVIAMSELRIVEQVFAGLQPMRWHAARLQFRFELFAIQQRSPFADDLVELHRSREASCRGYQACVPGKIRAVHFDTQRLPVFVSLARNRNPAVRAGHRIGSVWSAIGIRVAHPAHHPIVHLQIEQRRGVEVERGFRL